MVFAIDDDEVPVDVRRLDAAKLQTSHPGFKESSQDRLVPDGNKIVATAIGQHLFDVACLENNYDGLVFLAPLESLAGVEPTISLIVVVLDEGLDVLQDGVDICAFLSLPHHELRKLLDNAQGEVFHLLNFGPLCAKTQKETEVVPIPLYGARGIFTNLDLNQILLNRALNSQDLTPLKPSIVYRNRAERVCHNKSDIRRNCSD